MRLSSGLWAPRQLRSPRTTSDAPAWARAMAAGAPRPPSDGDVDADGFNLSIVTGRHASLLRLSLPSAAALPAADLELRTAQAYRLLRHRLADLPHTHPVRFWNFLPGISQPMDTRRDRYMVFNAGRFAAFDGWFGTAGKFAAGLPAASAVGHPGDSLVIHCLAMSEPGVAVENPRQVPAFGYSPRYGPRPPCFSRATVVNAIDSNGAACRRLIVSGTASILGEQTVHRADLHAQLAQTLQNLQSLLAAADNTARLAAFESVRIYHPQPQHAPAVTAAAAVAFGPHTALELVHAPLCRSDLLTEIEGIAHLGDNSAMERPA